MCCRKCARVLCGVLPAASLLFRNRLGRSPFPVSGILRLGKPASIKQSPQYDFGAHPPCFPKRLEPLIELGDLPWTRSIFHLDEKRFRHKQMPSECICISFVTSMRLHIALIVNCAALMYQHVPQLLHEGEGLLGFRILLSDHDDGAIMVVQAEAQNQALFGNLPFAVVSIATEYQYTARFYRCPILSNVLFCASPQPLARNAGCFGRVIARQLWRFKSRYIRVVQLFAKTSIYF